MDGTELYDKKDAMPQQAGQRRAPDIGTELSFQCKYGVIHSQMPPFQQTTPSWDHCSARATGQLLANLIQHGYNRVGL